jgi:hypothetical protein
MIVVNGADGEKNFDLFNAGVAGTVGPYRTVCVSYTENNGRMIASSVKVIDPRVSMNYFVAGNPDTIDEYGVLRNPGN